MQFFPKIWSKQKSSPSFEAVLKGYLGYSPRNKSVYQTAFTHRSMNTKNDQGVYVNFERLEFLGDSAIGTVVANYLYSELREDDEGELTVCAQKLLVARNLIASVKN